MIDLYLARSGNSLRAAIALEECGLPHRKVHVDLEAGEHRRLPFIQLNPFGTVPVMVDSGNPDGPPIILAQSGLIMMHTAEKSGCLIPRDHRMRLLTMQLFFAAISDVASANAIIKYFARDAPHPSDDNQKYLTSRLFGMLDPFEILLEGKPYFVEEITIADLALYPIVHIRRDLLAAENRFPLLLDWHDRLSSRPAVRRAASL